MARPIPADRKEACPVSTQPGRSRRGSWRIVIPVVVIALVLIVPLAEFVGRFGQDIAGDVGYYAGIAVAAVAVLALAALVAYFFTTLYGVTPTRPPANPTTDPPP
jgi:hypothetical protein